MNLFIIYFIKVILIQLLLFLIYKLFFSKSGQHKYNRIYLLFLLCISYIIPFLKLPVITPQEILENDVKLWLQGSEIEVVQMQDLAPVLEGSNNFSIYTTLLILVILGAVFMSIRSIYCYVQIQRLKRKSQLINSSWFSLYRADINTSFTFMTDIFMPQSIIDSTVFNQVLKHECVHVKKLHSIDRILTDVLISITWFNPVQYFIRKELIELHEFQADEEVVRYSDPIDYQEILFQQLQNSSSYGIASYFAFSTIKKRINMINNNRKKPVWIYSLSIPFLFLIGMVFTGNNSTGKVPGTDIEITSNIIKTLALDDPYKPSIYPLEKGVKIEITSKFGPVEQQGLNLMKIHEGIDFAVAEGTKVLATAKGKIIKAEKSGNYGLKITIDHNGTYKTSYAHLSELLVKEGQVVEKGDVIGLSGNTGASIFPHLHYEVESAETGLIDPNSLFDGC